MATKLLFNAGDRWTERVMRDTLDAATEIAYNDLGLDLYQNQVVIVAESGMLDAYAHSGLPHLYPHWSFGKRAKELEQALKNGALGLAYEMIIPTDPTISWNLASNSAATMAAVLAHAAIGHNFVFKNNYLYRKHTDAAGLASYCMTVRDTVNDLERKYGIAEVEAVLDAAHSLAVPCGVFRHGAPAPFDAEKEKKRIAEHMRTLERTFDPMLADTIPRISERMRKKIEIPEKGISLPEENILWFIETYSPKLLSWQKELIRIVRTIAQQVYLPGWQVKILHEGWAMFAEWYILKKLYEAGRLDDGTWLEIVDLTQAVIFQPNLKRHRNLARAAHHNPYAFGFAMFKDIVRIAGPQGDDARFFEHEIDTQGPTEEDKRWFRTFAGSGDWRHVLKDAGKNYHDETFIQQFLSPRLMREFGLFHVKDQGPHLEVMDIHDEEGYLSVRDVLAEAHSFDGMHPHIQITSVDLEGDRQLNLVYRMRNGMHLHKDDKERTLRYLEGLWGYDIRMSTK